MLLGFERRTVLTIHVVDMCLSAPASSIFQVLVCFVFFRFIWFFKLCVANDKPLEYLSDKTLDLISQPSPKGSKKPLSLINDPHHINSKKVQITIELFLISSTEHKR